MRTKKKEFFCTLLSEKVKITLKTKISPSRTYDNERYIQCNQFDCQYVDENIPPCPLTLDLFAEEIKEREERRKAKKDEDYY